MEKRLILAIALSLLVLLTWSALVPKPQVVDNQGVATSNLGGQPVQQQAPTPIQSLPVQEEVKTEPIKFVQDSREIFFDSAKASIREVIFKDGVEHRFALGQSLATDGDYVFKLKNRSSDTLIFVYEDQIRRITKKFFIPKDSYIIGLETSVQNLSPSPILLNPQLILGRLDLSAKNPQARFQDIYLGALDKSMHLSAGKDFFGKDVKFIGLRDQYFCAIAEPAKPAASAYVKKINVQESQIGLSEAEINLKSGAQIGHSYKIYIGPQDLKILNSIKPDWTGIIYFGTFDIIAQLLLHLVGFFYSIVHNWGWALIMLSLAVYFILFPLSIKQMRSMKEMQALQPKIEALRVEYKNNPQRLNKEIMELYKEHKVNPFSGCLPLLLQMPIFFALYQALIRSNALRGADFLWIKDLSAPDKLFVLKNSIPFLGNQVNILPILMAIGMFIQQKISMSKATGEAAQQQKMMVIIMPIMFGVIFYQMPSGLVLYWFVNSVLMLLYQFRLNAQPIRQAQG